MYYNYIDNIYIPGDFFHRFSFMTSRFVVDHALNPHVNVTIHTSGITYHDIIYALYTPYNADKHLHEINTSFGV